jgi:hypothetical protein
VVESKLIITSDDGSGYPDIVIQSLDGVHMFYQQAGESAYYTNMEKFMPGTWKASWQDAWLNDQLLVLGITDGKLEMKNKDGGHVDFERVTGE